MFTFSSEDWIEKDPIRNPYRTGESKHLALPPLLLLPLFPKCLRIVYGVTFRGTLGISVLMRASQGLSVSDRGLAWTHLSEFGKRRGESTAAVAQQVPRETHRVQEPIEVIPCGLDA